MDHLLSGNGRFTLLMQDDGNLVIYRDGVPVWASESAQPDVPVPPPLTDARIVRGNFCNLTDSLGRAIFSSSLAALSPTEQADWIALEQIAGGTHYTLSIQTGYDRPDVDPIYQTVINFYDAGRMSEWLQTLDRVLDAGLVPIVMLTSGDGWPGTSYLTQVIKAIPSRYYGRCIWVCGWECVRGAWSSRQYRDGNVAIRQALGPDALMGCHLSPERLSFASNPVEADDPWHGDEPSCWRDGWEAIGGHPFQVFLYQSPVVAEGDNLDVLKPGSWGERAQEVADRVLGHWGAPDWFVGLQRPTLVWYEATAYTFIRGQSTSGWAREVARQVTPLGYQGFGNGLP